MHSYYLLRQVRLLGARVHIHWSVGVVAALLFAASWRQPLHALVAAASYFGIILLHEVGHALFAKRLGYQPFDIYLSFVHGCCVYEQPHTFREQAIVAWGGVLVQLGIALPLIALNSLTKLGSVPYFGALIAFLGYFSFLVALMNLAPARGLDGALAWRLIPILLRETRKPSKRSSQSAKQSVVRRIK